MVHDAPADTTRHPHTNEVDSIAVLLVRAKQLNRVKSQKVKKEKTPGSATRPSLAS